MIRDTAVQTFLNETEAALAASPGRGQRLPPLQSAAGQNPARWGRAGRVCPFAIGLRQRLRHSRHRLPPALPPCSTG